MELILPVIDDIIASAKLPEARALVASHDNVSALFLDASDPVALESLVSKVDLVIRCVPLVISLLSLMANSVCFLPLCIHQ